MKIITDRTHLTYKDLHIGDVFEYDFNYYIVTDMVNPINNRYKAIRLRTGFHCGLNGEEEVKLCEATLHIKPAQ